jgi:hypothetical protein
VRLALRLRRNNGIGDERVLHTTSVWGP